MHLHCPIPMQSPLIQLAQVQAGTAAVTLHMNEYTQLEVVT